MPASSGGDRYQVSYFLDDDDLGHPTGKLYLTEHNLFFGDSLNALSAGTLPVVVGDLYTFSVEGRVSGGSLLLRAKLTDTTTSHSISVSATDSANVLGGSFFGYLVPRLPRRTSRAFASLPSTVFGPRASAFRN